MKLSDRLCSLTLDELSIESKYEFDATTGSIMGGVTFPGSSGAANHAIVFMLSGIASRWKQTIAYHFTGTSID